jgi:hypothetical protein
MEMSFIVGDSAVTFRRSAMTGRAELRIGDDRLMLQSPFSFATHISPRTRQVWHRSVDGHEVEIARQRKQWFGGLRKSTYSATVDGQPASEATAL